MKIQTTRPTGQAQTFDVAETFFSTTDSRGVITAGNQVFCRTSGYSLDQMLGQPHNLIRHPDMPRQVFRQLWETIRGGRSFMGYVKNQAHNGNHYWVYAVVVPIPEGYLSVRIKPTSPMFAEVEALYRRMVQIESDAIAAGASESQAANASLEALEAEIRRHGFATYEAFSHHAFNTEIKSRDAEIARRALRLFPEELKANAADGDGDLPAMQRMFVQGRAVYQAVNDLFVSLDGFIDLCRDIRQRHDAVQVISEEFRLNAMNAHLAATPLGSEGITLGTVALILNGHGQTLSRHVKALAGSIVTTTTAVADVASNLSAARLQLEMLLSFLAEIASAPQRAVEMHKLQGMIEALRTGFTTTLERAFGAVDTLQSQLPGVLGAKEQLRKDIIYLQVAQISGLTEVSRLRDAEGLQATFTGLRAQIERGTRELEQLDVVVDQLKALTNTTPPKVVAIRRTMDGVALTGAAKPALGRPAAAAVNSTSRPTTPPRTAPQLSFANA